MRKDSLTGDWYACSAHMLWVGERTRQLDGAHVEFFSGVHNPIGVKVGPDGDARRGRRRSASASTRSASPGRLTLIARLGADAACRSCCRRSLRAVREPGSPCVWVVRPDAREHVRHAAAGTRRGASTT